MKLHCTKCNREWGDGIDYCTICSNPSEGYWQMLREKSDDIQPVTEAQKLGLFKKAMLTLFGGSAR